MDDKSQAEMRAQFERAKRDNPRNQQGGFQQQQHRGGKSNNHRGGNQGGWGGQDNGDEVPLQLRNFLDDFATAVVDKRIENLEEMYIRDYPKFCDQLFRNKLNSKSQKWPSLDEARSCLGDSHNVHILYKELYYRHVFARLEKQITPEDRVDSWENYTKIFHQLTLDLNGNEQALLKAVPISWLWDLLDEFLYQYQSYCQFKARAIGKKQKAATTPAPTNPQDMKALQQVDAEFAVVKENPQLFEPGEVFNIITKVIQQTNIDNFLKYSKGDAADVPVATLPSEQARYLGYFAKVQMIRYNIMLGEYDVALKTAQTLDLGAEKPLYFRSPACHVALMYYLAFSLMMSKRHSDSMNIISKTLYFIQKLQRFPALAELYAPQAKTQERMTRLLILCDTFSPDNYHVQIEENLYQSCLDRHNDDIKILKTWGHKDTTGDNPYAAKVVELFNLVAPRFVTLVDVTDSQTVINPMEGHNKQWERFWRSVQEQKIVPMVRNILRMYTNIHVSKLTKLCNFPSEEDCIQQLPNVQRIGRQIVMREGENTWEILPGVQQQCTDLAFNYDPQTKEITVTIDKQKKNMSQTYLREIKNLQEILTQLKSPDSFVAGA